MERVKLQAQKSHCCFPKTSIFFLSKNKKTEETQLLSIFEFIHITRTSYTLLIWEKVDKYGLYLLVKLIGLPDGK